MVHEYRQVTALFAMKTRRPTGLARGNRKRFPYEPRVIGGRLLMPAELQRIHQLVLDGTGVIPEETRDVVEVLWPELVSKLPQR